MEPHGDSGLHQTTSVQVRLMRRKCLHSLILPLQPRPVGLDVRSPLAGGKSGSSPACAYAALAAGKPCRTPETTNHNQE